MADVDPHDKTATPLDETAAEAPRRDSAPKGAPVQKIGPYTLIDLLGEGGMGVVWRAHDPKLDRQIAIKVLKRNDAPQSLRQRLQREARAMARLKHPNVLTVYDSGTEGDRDYIAMELVDGSSVDIWLAQHPTHEEVVAAILAAGRGLAAAHRAGLVHRDFKPHNILRSNDGRVLVTDFGLARGLGEEVAGEATTNDLPTSLETSGTDATIEAVRPSGKITLTGRGSKTDSVLDMPLTQTGVLIGTPAYMAPEQFEGAPPDPRTDQFAFCVTAWQMLTGGRPHHGGSLDEMRKAAGAGATHLKTMLSPAVRAVLVRGLEPYPDTRWPDMDSLLAAFEKATRPRRPLWVVPAVVVLAVGVLVAGIALARRSNVDDGPKPCDTADVAFGDAWSPSIRASLQKELSNRPSPLSEPAFERIATPFDAFRTNWMRSYDEACRVPPAKLPRARLSCLFAARDNVGALQLVLRQAPTNALIEFDPYGILPTLTSCDRATAVTQPVAPLDRRPKVIDVFARSFGLRFSKDLDATLKLLEDEARGIGWPPLVPAVQMSGANELLRRERFGDARSKYAEALTGAKASNDPRLSALIRLGMLEASIAELEDPNTKVLAGELPEEIKRKLSAASATSKTAGNDPVIAGSLALLEAQALGARANWTRDKNMYREAIAAAQAARKAYEEGGDMRRAAVAAAAEAEIKLARGDSQALEDATFLTRSAAVALEAAKLPALPALLEIQARASFARGDFAVAATRFAQLWRGERDVSEDSIEIRGRVTGTVIKNGKGVEGGPRGAIVVAWVGEMHGDPVNLVTDVRTLEGERVQAEADGSFVLHAPIGAAIVAQDGSGFRSTPMVITDANAKALNISIPTREVSMSGGVQGVWSGELRAFARHEVGTASWYVEVPVRSDKSFSLTNLPETNHTLVGVIGTVGDGKREVLQSEKSVDGRAVVVWRSGPPLDVIVRGTSAPDASFWVFPRTSTPLANRAAIEAYARTGTNVGFGELHPVGASATPGGSSLYKSGDRHGVLTNNPEGPLTVCASQDGRPSAVVVCLDVKVTANAEQIEPAPVLIEVPDVVRD